MSNTPDGRPSIYKFPVELIPTLNRATVLTVYAAGTPVTFAIRHDKRSAALQFQPASDNKAIKNGDVRVNMYRNLDNCLFASTFFEMDTSSDKTTDIRGRFVKTKAPFSKYLLQFTQERHDFATKLGAGNTSNNYMLVDGWKTLDADNDLIFIYVQRVVYNDITRIKIHRSAAIQFSTLRGEDILNRYAESSNESFHKLGDDDDIPDFLKDLDDIKIIG